MNNMFIEFQNETKQIMIPKNLHDLQEMLKYKLNENACDYTLSYKDKDENNIEIKNEEQFQKILQDLLKEGEPKLYAVEKNKNIGETNDKENKKLGEQLHNEGDSDKLINNDLINKGKGNNEENNKENLNENNLVNNKSGSGNKPLELTGEEEDTIKKEYEKAQKDLEEMKDKYNKLENENKELKSKYQELSDENTNLKKDNEKQKNQILEKEKEEKRTKEEYDKKISENNSLQQKIKEYEKENEEMKNKIKEYEKEKILNDNRIKKLKENEENLNKEISELKIKETKYIEIIKNNKKEKKPTCNTIHNGIKCEKCFKEPIIGYRYKCIQCDNYNLCQDCEEKNAINEDHPHYFIKIRKEYKNNTIIFETNDYSYKCLNSKLESHIYQGVDEAKITLSLKNDKTKWPEGKTKLIIDRSNSMIDGENINLKPLNNGEQENYEINFKGLKNKSPQEYKVYYYLNINGRNYGDKLCFTINIENVVDKFRKKYEISKEKYSDEKILQKLQDNNYNLEAAFFGLYFS